MENLIAKVGSKKARSIKAFNAARKKAGAGEQTEAKKRTPKRTKEKEVIPF